MASSDSDISDDDQRRAFKELFQISDEEDDDDSTFERFTAEDLLSSCMRAEC